MRTTIVLTAIGVDKALKMWKMNVTLWMLLQILGIISDDESKIVGGYPVAPGQFPWVLGIWSKRSSMPFCGASLITDTWAVTAAHCVYNKKINK